LKKIILVFFILTGFAYSQNSVSGKAQGLFLSLALGPRIPIQDFNQRNSLGYGINVDISYTDNEFIPLFLYGKIGYEHFPGSTEFYRKSDYSALSTNQIPISLGAKLFFPPLVEDLVLIVPTIEFGGSYLFYETSHQFKIDSGRNNFIEDNSKIGFQIGAGLSMFLIEVMGYYNYFPQHQSISADLKVRIPIFIKL